MTKMEKYAILKDMVAQSTGFDAAVTEEVMAMIDTTMAQLTAGTEKAKARAQKAKAASDEMKSTIYEALTSDFMTVEQILEQFDGDEAYTKQKVIARLTALVKEGVVEKGATKVEGHRGDVSTYRKIA